MLAIVIDGKDMCSSGGIANYQKAALGSERRDVLFVGYQAEAQSVCKFSSSGRGADLWKLTGSTMTFEHKSMLGGLHPVRIRR